MNCPDCDTPTVEHRATFDGKLYECKEHGLFGIAGSAELRWSEFTKEERAYALSRARKSQTSRKDSFPVVTSYDLY